MGKDREPLVETTGITKRFGGVTALSDVNLTLYPSEVMGIVGDNGAGKSTLIKILSGAHHPDGGEIHFEGRSISELTPRLARKLGIETVYQNLALIDQMNVADNIFLGREIVRRFLGIKLVNKKKMQDEAGAYLNRLGIKIKAPKTEVKRLSGGERQSVSIARAIFTSPKMVILDEPTAALAIKEANMVLDLVRTLRKEGISVILISHTMPQVFEVCDRIMVLRHGKKVFEANTADTNMSEVVGYIVGA